MGRNWNKKKTKQIAIRVSPEEKAQMESLAHQSGFDSLSDWVRSAMKEAVRAGSHQKKGTMR